MIHTRHIAPFVLFVSFVVRLHSAPVPTAWDVNAAGTPEPAAAVITAFQGETLTLSPRFYVGRTPQAFASNATVAFYWQTNGMGTSYWAKAGALGALTGQVTAIWSPTNDVGARAYNFFFRVAAESGTTYRAFGKLQMLASPGFTPATLPLPTSWGDSLTSLSNVLWVALTNEAVQRAAADAGLTQHVAAVVGASGTVWRAEWQANAASTAGATNAAHVAANDPHGDRGYTDDEIWDVLPRNGSRAMTGPLDFGGHCGTNIPWLVLSDMKAEGRRVSFYAADLIPVYSVDGSNETFPIWSEGNQGAGTGMDADKVDGLHAADILSAAVTNGGATVNGYSVSNGAAILVATAAQGALADTALQPDDSAAAMSFAGMGASFTTAVQAAGIPGVVTNGGATVNGFTITNGAAINLTAGDVAGVARTSGTATNLTVLGGSAGAGNGALIVTTTNAWGSPYTQRLQSWKNSAGTEIAYLRGDGFLGVNYAAAEYFRGTGNGSAGTPMLQPAAATAGIYFPTATSVGFSSSGTNTLTVSATGATLPGALIVNGGVYLGTSTNAPLIAAIGTTNMSFTVGAQTILFSELWSHLHP
jgi:hypothetical protein